MSTGWMLRHAGQPIHHQLALDEVAARRGPNLAPVVLDHYAASQWPRDSPSDPIAPAPALDNQLKEEAVSELRQLFYGYAMELPHHPTLVGDLVMLEQNRLPSGRIRIAAPPGGHDHYATALMARIHDLALQPT